MANDPTAFRRRRKPGNTSRDRITNQNWELQQSASGTSFGWKFRTRRLLFTAITMTSLLVVFDLLKRRFSIFEFDGLRSVTTSVQPSTDVRCNASPHLLHPVPTDGIDPNLKVLKPFRFWYRSKMKQYWKAVGQFGVEIRCLMETGQHHLIHNDNTSTPHRQQQTTDSDFIERMRLLAPWLKGDPSKPGWPLSALPAPVENRQAIVISAGNPQLSLLKVLLFTIRIVHSSSIPVRIAFRDTKDLSITSQDELLNYLRKEDPNAAENIEFIDISKWCDPDVADIKGWNLKAFAMLLTPETEVALLDADVLLLQPPEKLFLQSGYVRTGALFFHDRTIAELAFTPFDFIRTIQPNLSPHVKKLLEVNTEHIQEGGVVLVDKKRRGLGLWAACLFAGLPDLRRFTQKFHHYGDKEMYWSSFEAISEPFEFSRFYPGAMGGVLTDFSWTHDSTSLSNAADARRLLEGTYDLNHTIPEVALCGRLLHFDDSGDPLWSNGGYETKESDWQEGGRTTHEPVAPVLFIDGGDTSEPLRSETIVKRMIHTGLGPGENQRWKTHLGMGVMCLYPNRRNIRFVSPQAQDKAAKTINEYFRLERELRSR